MKSKKNSDVRKEPTGVGAKDTGGAAIVPTVMGNPAPRARARSTPGKITADCLAGICRLIAEGGTRAGACAEHGVTDSSLRELRSRHPEIDAQVAQAEAAGAEHYRTLLLSCPAGTGAPDDWKRYAWIAERLHPKEYAPPKQTVAAAVEVAADENTIARVAAALAAINRDDGET